MVRADGDVEDGFAACFLGSRISALLLLRKSPAGVRV
jgi:hypothetical protein